MLALEWSATWYTWYILGNHSSLVGFWGFHRYMHLFSFRKLFVTCILGNGPFVHTSLCNYVAIVISLFAHITVLSLASPALLWTTHLVSRSHTLFRNRGKGSQTAVKEVTRPLPSLAEWGVATRDYLIPGLSPPFEKRDGEWGYKVPTSSP